ncbi:MAG: hypothetical protein IPL40_10135 [Proteobacteria bacterium]|nr:hypothetical protein [Pseudomonadota bacterium]
MAQDSRGSTLGGFHLGERLHVGEGSESYVCVRPGDPALLLLKRVAPPAEVRPFLATVEVERRFEHPVLCRQMETGRDGEAVFSVRELALGKDLRGIVRRLVLQQQAVDEATALWVTRELCLALEHIHQRVKAKDPVRCQIRTRSVVLSDDGAVHLVGPLAPGSGVDPVADIRALGLCLHEMLTGTLSTAEQEAAGPPAGSLAAGLIEGALAERSVSRLREAIEERTKGQSTTRECVAELVKRVFPRGRQTEDVWRANLRQAARSAAVADTTARSVAMAELTPAATAADAVPTAASTTTPPALSSQRTGLWSWPAGARLPVRGIIFALVATLSALFVVYRLVVMLSPQPGRVVVRSELPIEVVVDGVTPGQWAPCDLVLPKGPHRFLFRFPGTGREFEKVVEVPSHEVVELRLHDHDFAATKAR